MDNKEDIEILDDFEFDDEIALDENNTINDQNETNSSNSEQIKEEQPENNDDKEEIENPVVEMINNKTTMKLIGIMLIVLFIAVFLMPKVFELING